MSNVLFIGGIIFAGAAIVAVIRAYRKVWIARAEAESQRIAREQVEQSQAIDETVAAMSDDELDSRL